MKEITVSKIIFGVIMGFFALNEGLENWKEYIAEDASTLERIEITINSNTETLKEQNTMLIDIGEEMAVKDIEQDQQLIRLDGRVRNLENNMGRTQ